jgi:hypothetical protein
MMAIFVVSSAFRENTYSNHISFYFCTFVYYDMTVYLEILYGYSWQTADTDEQKEAGLGGLSIVLLYK